MNRSAVTYDSDVPVVIEPGQLVQVVGTGFFRVANAGPQGPAGPQGAMGVPGQPGRNATTVVYRNSTAGGVGNPIGTRNGLDGRLPPQRLQAGVSDPWVRSMNYQGPITKTVQQPDAKAKVEFRTQPLVQQEGRGVVVANGFKSKLVLASKG